ncbi:RodZ domain-containing protein [Metapseudomonas otitidis]|uniref:RodZ domain-containing protein n=1 Tax=Metapseudomonas otitidis TaxID=319939 RepID=UPI0013F5EC8D|nr:RodZ family helix-turn-helix domain-containing protein [Pseudomonas otitidis]
MKASQPEPVAATRGNPGEVLRQARENQGLDLADIARQLNLTEYALRQLEAGSFEQLPGHTFARGYIRAYAKLIGLDQAELVAEFDRYTGTDATGSSVHSLGRIEEPVRLSQSVLRFVSFAILVALGVIGFLWWQDQAERRASDNSELNLEHVEVESADGTTQIHPLDELEDQAVAGTQQEAQAGGETAATPEAAPHQPATPAQAPVVAAAAPATAQPVQPNTAAPSTAPTQTTVPAQPPAPAVTPGAPVVAAAGQGVVRVQFTANCWFQLTDAGGSVLQSGIKRSGESIEAAGKPPLELRLGYARGAQVSYNGQPVDIAPFIHGETARLKLGQ